MPHVLRATRFPGEKHRQYPPRPNGDLSGRDLLPFGRSWRSRRPSKLPVKEALFPEGAHGPDDLSSPRLPVHPLVAASVFLPQSGPEERGWRSRNPKERGSARVRDDGSLKANGWRRRVSGFLWRLREQRSRPPMPDQRQPPRRRFMQQGLPAPHLLAAHLRSAEDAAVKVSLRRPIPSTRGESCAWPHQAPSIRLVLHSREPPPSSDRSSFYLEPPCVSWSGCLRRMHPPRLRQSWLSSASSCCWHSHPRCSRQISELGVSRMHR